MTKSDMLLGGPGLDGYAYQADVYCVPCGRAMIARLPDRDYSEVEAGDSERVPVPVFWGEHEEPQHCAKCGAYLYGGAS